MHLTWLDSNTWLIEFADKRILLDPWLVDDLAFGNAKWFFRGFRQHDRQIPENIDLILLSQGLEDHAHPPTLKVLDKSIPVVGSPAAVKVVTALDFTTVHQLDHGDLLTLDALQIQATVGSPVGPTVRENGYVLKDQTAGTSLYYEPHGYHPKNLQQMAAIDVVLTPMIDLSIPPGLPVIKGTQSAIDVAQWVKPQVMLPTAAGGDIDFSGILIQLLKASGSPATVQAGLKAAGLQTQVIEPKPGDRVAIPLKAIV